MIVTFGFPRTFPSVSVGMYTVLLKFMMISCMARVWDAVVLSVMKATQTNLVASSTANMA